MNDWGRRWEQQTNQKEQEVAIWPCKSRVYAAATWLAGIVNHSCKHLICTHEIVSSRSEAPRGRADFDRQRARKEAGFRGCLCLAVLILKPIYIIIEANLLIGEVAVFICPGQCPRDLFWKWNLTPPLLNQIAGKHLSLSDIRLLDYLYYKGGHVGLCIVHGCIIQVLGCDNYRYTIIFGSCGFS